MSGFYENVDGHRVFTPTNAPAGPETPQAPDQQARPVATDLQSLLALASVNPDSLDRHYGVKLTFTREQATDLAALVPAISDRLHNAVGNAAADEDYDEQQRRDAQLLNSYPTPALDDGRGAA